MITPKVRNEGSAKDRHGASPESDPLYLFACHVEWHNRGNLRAYGELIAALGDCDEEIRLVAEALLTRCESKPVVVTHRK